MKPVWPGPSCLERDADAHFFDVIVDEVRAMNLSDDTAIPEELLKRTLAFNHVPT
jgi:hypothetical protein